MYRVFKQATNEIMADPASLAHHEPPPSKQDDLPLLDEVQRK